MIRDGYIKPIYKTINELDEYFTAIEFKGYKSELCEVVIKDSLFGKQEVIEILQSKGYKRGDLGLSNSNLLQNYLYQFNVSLIIKSVDSIGWHNNFKVYLLPFLDEQKNSYPKFDIKKPDNYIYHVKNTVVRKLKKTGTLKEWQNTVLKVCNPNSSHSTYVEVG